MTYTSGSIIQATDYTNLTGSTNNILPYVNEAACASKVSALFGVGYGTYGYGQAPFVLGTPTSGSPIISADWTNLLRSLLSMAQHQGISLTTAPMSNLPLEAWLAVSQTVAVDSQQITPLPPLVSYDWASAISAIQAARLTVDLTKMVEEPELTSVRSTLWSTSVEHEFVGTFPTQDSARFFFNSGGQIRLQPQITYTGADALTLDWQTLCAAVGKVCMGYTSTTRTGSTGTGSSVGYYDLTDTYATIFTATSSTYVTNTMEVQAKVTAVTSVNGGNGNELYFRFIFTNNAIGNVAASISTTITSLRCKTLSEIGVTVPAVNFPVVVATANFRTLVELTAGGIPSPPPPPPPPTIFEFTDYTNPVYTYNYNIYDAAVRFGYVVGSGLPIHGTLVVRSGTQLLSGSVEFPAFISPSNLPVNSQITVVVEGDAVVAGKGGRGGTGAPSGVCGCEPGGDGSPGGPAMQLNFPTKLINYGVIGGGGGGGGGGGSECAYVWNASAGGGGGGAGWGEGGGVNGCGVTAGRLGGVGGNGDAYSGGGGGGPGNIFTASGGNGGQLGHYGIYGQTIHSPGGAGGAPGLAISGFSQLAPGSQSGNLQGPVSG
jgi:hypothetical protein